MAKQGDKILFPKILNYTSPPPLLNYDQSLIRMFHHLFIVLQIPLLSMTSSHDPMIGMFHCLFIVLKIPLFSISSSHDLVSFHRFKNFTPFHPFTQGFFTCVSPPYRTIHLRIKLSPLYFMFSYLQLYPAS